MKTKKWTNKQVGEEVKPRKKYLTKAIKKTRREWKVLLGFSILCALVIYVPNVINNDIIGFNLEAQAKNEAKYILEHKNATEGEILPNFAMSEKFDPVKKDIIDVAQEKGFEDIGLLFYLAKYESNFDTYAIGINKHKTGVISLDRGVFQINHFYHPAISNECAFNVRCSTNETINIIRRDGGCQKWTTCPY